jgi:hypothetical protein
VTFRLEPAIDDRARKGDRRGGRTHRGRLVSVGNGLERRIDSRGRRRSRLERDWFRRDARGRGVSPARGRTARAACACESNTRASVPDHRLDSPSPDGTETETRVVLRSTVATVAGRATMTDGLRPRPAGASVARGHSACTGPGPRRAASGVRETRKGGFERRGSRAGGRAFLFAWLAEHPGVNAALRPELCARGETHVLEPGPRRRRPPLRAAACSLGRRIPRLSGRVRGPEHDERQRRHGAGSWWTDASGRARASKLLPGTGSGGGS